MKIIWGALSIVLLLAGPLSGGTLTGTVKARGTQSDSENTGDAYASRRYKFVEKLDYDQFHDFVIYIDQAVAGEPFAPPDKPAIIQQKDATFVPHVLPILVGTTVIWPNQDDIYHNVFSMSQTKSFDLGLYSADQPGKRVTFDKPGQVDAFCAIHTKMRCIVLVLTNPFFALADNKGRFTITGIPAGTYKVRAWHERMPSQWKEITVPAEGEVTEDFVLSLGDLQKY